MENQGIGLVWIVVKNMDTSLKFYRDVLGFTVDVMSEEHGWAELTAGDGVRLGIAKENEKEKAGINAVFTITVPDLTPALEEMKKKHVTFIGEVMEIPGHVKLQTLKDKDGNLFQIVQVF